MVADVRQALWSRVVGMALAPPFVLRLSRHWTVVLPLGHFLGCARWRVARALLRRQLSPCPLMALSGSLSAVCLRRVLLSQSAGGQHHAARHVETRSFNLKAPTRSIYARHISERVSGVRHGFSDIQASRGASAELIGSRLSSSLFESNEEEPTMNVTLPL